MDIRSKKIILASQSPRRKQLLSQAGFNFEIITNPIDESFPEEMPVEEVAEFLALNKAKAVLPMVEAGQLVLAADSVVILNNKIYGKPVDEEDAHRILGELSGQVHTVITGVCLADGRRSVTFSGVSRVYFNELTAQEIRDYVHTCQPFDKAGAYAIQEWIGLCKIEKIEGTYANVMGLPVNLVYQELKKWWEAE
jgi:septum formation protein